MKTDKTQEGLKFTSKIHYKLPDQADTTSRGTKKEPSLLLAYL